MENGTYLYDLEMSTPLGPRRGNLELIVWKGHLNGYLTMFTRTIPIQDGKCSGKYLSFRGDMKTLMKMIPYQAEGKITDTGISLVFSTPQNQYSAKGYLTERRG